MENFKKYMLLIFTVIIIIIAIIISIMLLKLKNNDNNIIIDSQGNKYHYHGEEEINTSIHVLTDTNTFYTVENCLNIYLDNMNDNNIKKENIAKKMWTVDINNNISVYYVFTKIRDKNTFDISNEENAYYTVILDKSNNTFSINSNGKEYSEEDLNAISTYSIDKITENNNNKYSDIIIYNEDIVKKYFNEYLKNALYKPAEAYKFLGEEYKNQKFSKLEDFEDYLNKNKSNLINATLLKYSVKQFEEYTEYTLVDNFNNYYIIKEKSVMDFSIFLDNYTLESEEFNNEYENASDEVKIATNVDKIFKMINNKEYENIYENYINKEFKNNYFSNYADFKTFMSNKFFDYNYLGNTRLDKQGNYYIINVNYKDGLSSAAEERSVKIILKLNENTDFEFSFEM